MTSHARALAEWAVSRRGGFRGRGVSLAPSTAMLSGTRILVADDDPELLDAVADAFVRLGAAVVRANNGAELIEELAEQGPFDLVVTDIAMPWMTGLRAIHAARAAGLGTSVIVMTALRDPSIPARVNALGHNAALLIKPFELADLESVASTMLALGRVRPRPNTPMTASSDSATRQKS